MPPPVLCYQILESSFGEAALGGVDGTGRVTHDNIGGKPARPRVILFSAWQTDGGRGRQ